MVCWRSRLCRWRRQSNRSVVNRDALGCDGAEDAGLALNWEDFDRQAYRFYIMEPTISKFGPIGLSALLLGLVTQDRAGPTDISDLSLAVLDRFQDDGSYRPAALGGILHQLYALNDKEWGDLRAFMNAWDRGATHDLDTHMRPRSRRF